MPSEELLGCFAAGRFSELEEDDDTAAGVRATRAPRGMVRSAGVEKMDDERMAERFNCAANVVVKFHVSRSRAAVNHLPATLHSHPRVPTACHDTSTYKMVPFA